MILIKQITAKNFEQFAGLECNVAVVEHKRGPERLRHKITLVGIIVQEMDGYYMKFSQGYSDGPHRSPKRIIETKSGLYDFYYIEIK